ncbi:MAG: hypothetical protein AB3X37_09675 [Leptothrix ochracea]|uniref:hypothetical protein n=1 Tax=Leptothrix ochracea TaxID=735331 RepID=UPI0034E1D118
MPKKTILERFDISEQELTSLVDKNPSLRGIMLGYVAEQKFHDLYLNNPNIQSAVKDDDHDRKKKGDRRIIYKGKAFVIEVKSLQTNTVKQLADGRWEGKSQVDGSDRREISFDDGTKLNTTLLKRGEFDILCVNCFAFGGAWRFVFAKNEDLPISNYQKYTPEQQSKLIASLVKITWPPQSPFISDFFGLLDSMI